MKPLRFCLVVLLAAPPLAAQLDFADEEPMKPPPEEYKLATLLADQGKYEDAIRHYKNLIRYFEEEDAKTPEEKLWLAVSKLHVTAFEFKEGLDSNRFGNCKCEPYCDWIELIFPAQPRAASAAAKQGKLARVRNSIDVRKLTRDPSYSGAVALSTVSRSAANQLLTWAEAGHRVLVQDGAAAYFGFAVAPLILNDQTRATVRKDRKALDHPLVANLAEFEFAGPTAGWLCTGHANAVPLLTVSLTLPPGQPAPRTPPAVCAIAKVGRGEIIFCNAALSTTNGDGAALYQNLERYLTTFPVDLTEPVE